jgi:hypothetical protein
MSAPTDTSARETPPRTATDFVCWSPTEETSPLMVRAMGPSEAAKIFVLRGLAKATHHDNEWSSERVLVVDYATGDSSWVDVRVRVEASQ